MQVQLKCCLNLHYAPFHLIRFQYIARAHWNFTSTYEVYLFQVLLSSASTVSLSYIFPGFLRKLHQKLARQTGFDGYPFWFRNMWEYVFSLDLILCIWGFIRFQLTWNSPYSYEVHSSTSLSSAEPTILFACISPSTISSEVCMFPFHFETVFIIITHFCFGTGTWNLCLIQIVLFFWLSKLKKSYMCMVISANIVVMLGTCQVFLGFRYPNVAQPSQCVSVAVCITL